ncbi:MAG: M20/M25/M40 family metallo-hydrolase [Candidatus Latescibacterota bacterium]
MTLDTRRLREALEARRQEAVELLVELIGIPSTRGQEGPAARFLQQRLRGVVDAADLVPVDDAIQHDPEYSFPLPDYSYADQPNLRLLKRGKGGGRSLIVNTHMDVVPPSLGQESPFRGRLVDGVVHGRGACDCKGQIATLYLALAALGDLSVELAGDLIGHLVIEEECGGNGTLSFVRGPDRADACLVLEPSEQEILPSVRGAVWFATTCYGRAGHSGQAGRTVSALKEAMRAIGILEGYHDRLLAASKGHPLYDAFPNPMPITFGTMHAGDWPAMAPNRATFQGVLGFLPTRTREQVMEEMRQALRAEGGNWLPDHFEMEFIYRHDCNEVPADHPLVHVLREAVRDSGTEPRVAAMPASCDAWFYTNLIGVPAVVMGAGSLGVAHSAQEQIAVADVVAGAEALCRSLVAWCTEASR